MKITQKNPWINRVLLGAATFGASLLAMTSPVFASPTLEKAQPKNGVSPMPEPTELPVSFIRKQLIANTACQEAVIPVIGIQTAGEGVPAESVGAFMQMGIGFIAGTTTAPDGTELSIVQTAAHTNQPNNELAAIKRDRLGNVAPAQLVHIEQELDLALLAVTTESVQSRRVLPVYTEDIPLGTRLFQCTQDGFALAHKTVDPATVNNSFQTFVGSVMDASHGSYLLPLERDVGGGGISTNHGDSGGPTLMVSDAGQPYIVGTNIAGDGDIIELEQPPEDDLNVIPEGRTIAPDAIGVSGLEHSFIMDASATQPYVEKFIEVSPLLRGLYEQGLFSLDRS